MGLEFLELTAAATITFPAEAQVEIQLELAEFLNKPAVKPAAFRD